jgi:hypothetical protein
MTLVRAIASLLAVWAVGPAFAGEGPCANDVVRLCRDVAPGGGRVIRCLETQRDQLSPSCRATAEARMNAMTRRHPCADDRERFCASIPNGQGRIISCLRAHAADLSPSCRRAIVARGGDPTR